MKTVDAKVTFLEKASRLELVIRIIWILLVSFVLSFFGIVAFVAQTIQWFYILFLGKRNSGLQVWIKAVVIQQFRLMSYASLLTDERPPIVPEVEKT